MEKLKLDIQKFASKYVGILYANGSSSEYGVYKCWFDYGNVLRVYNNPSGSISYSDVGPTSAKLTVSNVNANPTTNVTISRIEASHAYGGTASGTGNFFLAKKYSGSSKYTTNGVYVACKVGAADGTWDYSSGKIRCNSAGSASAASYVKSMDANPKTIGNVPVVNGTITAWVKYYADNSAGTDLRGITATYTDLTIENNNADVNCVIHYRQKGTSGDNTSTNSSWTLSNLTPATTYQYWVVLTNASTGQTYTSNVGEFTTTAATPKFNSYPTLSPATNETTLVTSTFTTDISTTGTVSIYKVGTSTAIETKTLTAGTSHAPLTFQTNLTANTEYYLNITIQNSTYTTYTASYNGNIKGWTWDYPKISSSSTGLNVSNSGTVKVTIYNPKGRDVKIAAYTASDGTGYVKGDTDWTQRANGTVVDFAFDANFIGQQLGSTGTSKTLYYICIYKNDSNQPVTRLYSSGTIGLTESFARPTISSSDAVKTGFFNYFDSNSTTTAITDYDTQILGNFSIPKFKLKAASSNPFTTNYGATLKEVNITCTAGTSYFIARTITTNLNSDNGTEYVFFSTTDPAGKAINDTNSITLKITGKDTRNYTNNYSITIPIIKTALPQITLVSVQRQSGDWEKIIFSYSGTTTPSNITGMFNCSAWELQKSTTGAENSYTKDTNVTISQTSATDMASTTTYDSQTQYYFRMKIVDALGQVNYSTPFSLPMGEPTIFIDVQQDGVGVNCFPQSKGLWVKTEYYNNSQWVAQDNKIFDIIYPVGSIYMSIQDKNPSDLFHIGSWTKIEGKFLIGANSSYAVDTSGGGAKLTAVPEHNHTGSVTINYNNFNTGNSGNHRHQVDSHTHDYSGSVSVSGGNHRHGYGWGSPYRAGDGSKWWTAGNSTTGGGSSTWTNWSGNISLSGSYSGTTTGASPYTGYPGDHNHNANHNHSGSISISNSGTSGGVSVPLPPWHAVYIWKRIA